MDEVVEDRLVRQLLDDPGAGGTAHEAGRDDRDTEQLQRTCDVDPLATRERHAGARAMALPTLEVRHGQRPVDRRVEGDGDDHAGVTRGPPNGGASCRRTTLDVSRGLVC